MAAGDTTQSAAKDGTQGSERMRYLVTMTIAVVLLLAFGLLVYYLNGKADGETRGGLATQGLSFRWRRGNRLHSGGLDLRPGGEPAAGRCRGEPGEHVGA